MGELKRAAQQLGGTSTVLRQQGWKTASPERIKAVADNPPDWLLAAQQRQQDHIQRPAKDKLRGELADALVTSVHEVWLQELKRATTDDEVDAIDARWAPEVGRAKGEARRLVDELSVEQVHARIDRERQAAHAAGVYRATQLVRRALGSADG